MNITPDSMVSKYLHRAATSTRMDAGEARELCHDIAMRFKYYGILPICQECSLTCTQAGVAPDSPLTGFYCPMNRGDKEIT